jgi:hypothetical protein
MEDKNLTTEAFGDVGQLVSDVEMLEKVEPKTIHHKTHRDDDEGEDIIVLELHTKQGAMPTTYEHLGGDEILIEGLREWAQENNLVWGSTGVGEYLIIREDDISDGHYCGMYAQTNIQVFDDGQVASDTPCSICGKRVVREYEQVNYETSQFRQYR